MNNRIMTTDERWQNGIEHDARSVAIFNTIRDIDVKYGGNSFDWQRGGDGDNGEQLMYILDIYFNPIPGDEL